MDKERGIIGLQGKMRVGKDEVASIIQYLTSDHGINGTRTYEEAKGKVDREGYGSAGFFRYGSNWEIKKYADKLKDCLCLILGCTRYDLEDPEFKEAELGEEWWYYDDGAVIVAYGEDDSKMDGYNTKLVKPTARTMIQDLGTDLIREQLHPNAWVNATFASYKALSKGKAHDLKDWSELYTHKECNNCGVGYSGYKRQYLCNECINDDSIQEYPTWILSDVRFHNEANAIEKRGGILINVVRPFGMRYPDYATYADGLKFSNALYMDYPDFYKKLTHRSETEIDNRKFDYTIVNDGNLDDLIDKVRVILIKEGVIVESTKINE